MKTKKEWRQVGKELLNNLSSSEHEAITKKITAHVLDTPWWEEAEVVGITISQGKEINTKPLIEQAWKEGKVVCVPKCISKTKEMQFYKIDSFEQLEKVYFNLLEPIVAETKPIAKEQIDLLFVPGLLFDKRGFRIGFGGGYYDRFLSNFNQVTISFLSEQQLIEEVPNESFDIAVQYLVTENGVIHL